MVRLKPGRHGTILYLGRNGAMGFFDRRSGKERRCWEAREDPCRGERKKSGQRPGRDRRSGRERRVSWEDHRARSG